MMTEYVERILNVDRDTANYLRAEYSRRYGATMLGLFGHDVRTTYSRADALKVAAEFKPA